MRRDSGGEGGFVVTVRPGEKTVPETTGAEMFREMVDRAPDPIAIFDSGMRYSYVNDAFCRVLGVEREGTVGKPVHEVHTLGRGTVAFEEALGTAYRTGRSAAFELTLGRAQDARTYRGRVVPHARENGAVASAFSYLDDITALKTAERREREQLLSMLEAVPVGVAILARDGNITYANSAAERILGLRRDEITQRVFNDPGWKITAVEGGPLPVEELPFYRVMRTGLPVRGVEHALERPDGTRTVLSVNAAPFKTGEGDVDGVIAVVIDITRQRQTEHELRASEQLSRDIISAAPFGAHLYELTGDGRLVFTGANPACDRILGTDCSAFIGKTIEEAFPPLAATRIPEAFRRVALRGEPYDQEQVAYDDRGISGVFEIHAFRTGYRRLAVFFQDITERKKSEEALRHSEERYRSMVEVTSDWIWEVDADVRYAYASPKVQDILGYEPGEMIGKTPFELMPPGERERVRSAFLASSRERRPFFKLENLTRRKDGGMVTLETSGVPVFDGRGRFTGYRGIDRDITDRKRSEDALRESYGKLENVISGIISAISKIVETRDPYTAGHQRRVAQLAFAMAKELDLPGQQADYIRIAGQIHDIGKIYVPAEILSKPGRLNKTEYDLIKVHPQAGYDILRNIAFPWPVAEVTYQHQERLDGSGYPRGLRADRILFETRIVSVADTVEAMSFFRPYRTVVGLDKALREIEQHRGVLYDERAVDACVRLFTEKGFRFEK